MAKSLISTLNRFRGIKLLQAMILVELSARPTGEMYGSELEALIDGVGQHLVPIVDKEAAIQGLLDESEIDVAVEGGLKRYDISTHSLGNALHERYGITNAGLTKLTVERKNRASWISKYSRRGGLDWIPQQLEDVYGEADESPLALLPCSPAAELDLASAPHFQRELLIKIDSLVSAISASNQFRMADEARYHSIIGSLEKLKVEASSPKTKAGRIEKIAFGSLSFLAKKFAESIIGILASDVWSIIIKIVDALK